jgi:mitogen-activated protein kinase 15
VWSAGCILGEIIMGKPIFPGTSTLNQIEKVIRCIGQPSAQDISAINSTLAGSLLESLRKTSITGFKD